MKPVNETNRSEIFSPLLGGNEKPKIKTARRMKSISTYNSQIVFGTDTNTHMKSQNRIVFSNTIENKENNDSINVAGLQKKIRNYDSIKQNQEVVKPSKAQRPKSIKICFKVKLFYLKIIDFKVYKIYFIYSNFGSFFLSQMLEFLF